MQFDYLKNPFFIIALISVLGIIFGKFFFSFEISILLGGFFLILYFLINYLHNSRYISITVLILALFFAAATRINSAYLFNNDHITQLNIDNICAIEGKVIHTKYKPENYNQYIISLKNIVEANDKSSANGKIVLYTAKIGHKFLYGDVLHARCTLKEPKGSRNPGQFDYQKYLADQDIYYVANINHIDSVSIIATGTGNYFTQFIVIPLKKYVNSALKKYTTKENYSFLNALLLGEKQYIDQNVINMFKNVGVVHVLAISGLHVGFIILFIFTFLSFFRLKYHYKIIILMVILFIYVAVINFKAPVLRASIMAFFYLIGKLYERKVSIFNIIFFTAFALLIVDPRDLFDPGFQFSFVAVLSIVYGYPKLDSLIPLKKYIITKYNHTNKIKWIFKIFWDPFLVSISAVLGTLPLTLYYYGIFPVYSIFANIIVIPIIGLIVFLGIFLILFSIISNVLATNLGNFIDLFFSLLKSVIVFFNGLPYSYISTSTPSIMLVFLLFVIFYCLINFQSRPCRISLIGFIAFFILYLSYNKHNSNQIEVTFLDVGQGDAAMVKFTNGTAILIDGGDHLRNWNLGKNVVIPFLKYNNVSRLKYVVASHPHNDHIGGLVSVLKTQIVDTLVLSAYQFNTNIYKEMLKICKKRNVFLRYVQCGDQLFPDVNSRVYVLHPNEKFVQSENYNGKECNNSSIVLKIQYGSNSILFTGDAEHGAEKSYTKYGHFLKSEIVKLGHHGSKTSTGYEMLTLTNPLAGIISVAEKNKFRHPSRVTMKKLKEYRVKPFLTSKEGAIKFIIKKNNISFRRLNKNLIKLF